MQQADVTNPGGAAPAPTPTQPALSPELVRLLAGGAGAAVAAIYYAQPMLGDLAADAGSAVTLVPMVTQLGYALGILLLAPLGDRYDRRRIILGKAGALAVALLGAALAPSAGALLVASVGIGAAATLAQDIVPAAATLAPPAARGKVVGTVMTGLLLGILLSRVVSGLVSEHLGWRAMFGAAAGSIALVGAAVWRRLPAFAPTTQLPYARLLASLWQLWRANPALRRATLAQALLCVGFSAYWSTLAVMLHAAPFHLGAGAAGAFGLAGAAGALAAPIAGRLSDRRGPGPVTRAGAAIAIACFAAMGLGAGLPAGPQLALLAACTVGFDLGVQASLIAHQTIIYSLAPEARSRLNAVLLVGMFIGMAAGAALGALALARVGWAGVMALATAAATAALAVRAWPARGGAADQVAG